MRAKKTFTEECGCRYEQNKWVSYCTKHQKELDEIHKRACEEYRNWSQPKEKHHDE